MPQIHRSHSGFHPRIVPTYSESMTLRFTPASWAALRVVAWLAATSTVAFACGPSFETLHESNIRFEHCNRLDLDERVARNHRLYCWQQWRSRYTYGQTRDRLQYAEGRIKAIRLGEPGPTAPKPAAPSASSSSATPDDPARAAVPAVIPAPSASAAKPGPASPERPTTTTPTSEAAPTAPR